jgi:ribosomal-protein-alanine N-acetyltransferase
MILTTERLRLRVDDDPMQTGELIGCVGVRRESPDDPSANVGYELNPGHWGRGYASEAMASLLRFAFDEVGLDELTCRIVDGNAPSIRLAARLGFVRSLDLPEGPGKDGRIWPQRAEYVLSRAAWPPS